MPNTLAIIVAKDLTTILIPGPCCEDTLDVLTTLPNPSTAFREDLIIIQSRHMKAMVMMLSTIFVSNIANEASSRLCPFELLTSNMEHKGVNVCKDCFNWEW